MGNTQKPIIKQGKLLTDIRDQMKPFDLLVFRGDDFLSYFISLLEKRGHKNAKGGNFTHVGMIVTSDILNNPLLQQGKLYILESVISGQLGYGINDINDKAFLGVQIRDLEKLIPAYDLPNHTSIAWCPLINHPYEIDNVKEKFTTLCNSVYGTTWDANCWSLLSAIYPILRPCRSCIEHSLHTEEWLFCSELIATIYKEFEVLPEYVNPKNVLPADLVYPEEDTDTMVKIVSDIVYITSPIHYSPKIDPI